MGQSLEIRTMSDRYLNLARNDCVTDTRKRGVGVGGRKIRMYVTHFLDKANAIANVQEKMEKKYQRLNRTFSPVE